MRPSFLVIAALAFAACDPDPDGDGLTSAEERELGTDPREQDSDGDGLPDGIEVNLQNTDPTNPDSDDDGLTDGAEVMEHSTDPTAPDSDMDGFLDGEEVEFGSDPNDYVSYERTTDGRWPDTSSHAEGQGEGWGMNQRVTTFQAVDQYGQTIDLEQFYGNVILVDFGAGWCGPCRAVARHAEDMYRRHADKGFLVFHYMIDDNSGGGGVTDPNFIKQWADDYGATFPVVYDESLSAYQAAARGGLYQGGIPFMMLLDQELKVVGAVTGSGGEARLEQQAIGLLD